MGNLARPGGGHPFDYGLTKLLSNSVHPLSILDYLGECKS